MACCADAVPSLGTVRLQWPALSAPARLHHSHLVRDLSFSPQRAGGEEEKMHAVRRTAALRAARHQTRRADRPGRSRSPYAVTLKLTLVAVRSWPSPDVQFARASERLLRKSAQYARTRRHAKQKIRDCGTNYMSREHGNELDT
jgi:hypothetical protein